MSEGAAGPQPASCPCPCKGLLHCHPRQSPHPTRAPARAHRFPRVLRPHPPAAKLVTIPHRTPAAPRTNCSPPRHAAEAWQAWEHQPARAEGAECMNPSRQPRTQHRIAQRIMPTSGTSSTAPSKAGANKANPILAWEGRWATAARITVKRLLRTIRCGTARRGEAGAATSSKRGGRHGMDDKQGDTRGLES